jgi:hypothetical protein
MKNQLWIAIALCALAGFESSPAFAQTQLIMAGGQVQATAGEHAVLCATNFGPRPVTATLEFMDALTGALINPQTITLGAGSNLQIRGACEEIVVTKAVEILIGLVKVTGVPQAQAGNMDASFQVYGAGLSGSLLNARVVPLAPASTTNAAADVPRGDECSPRNAAAGTRSAHPTGTPASR